MIAWILSTLLLGDISQGGAVAAGSVSPATTPTPQAQQPVQAEQPSDEEDDTYFSDEEEGYMDEDFSDQSDDIEDDYSGE